VEWTEATPTFTQVTANLKILGGDADVDNFIQATYANPNDIEAEVVTSRAKSIAHIFSDFRVPTELRPTDGQRYSLSRNG